MSAEIRVTSATGAEKGTKLERFDLIPVGPLTELAKLYGIGAKKYAEHNWRKGYPWSLSYSALQRHASLFWNGEHFDFCPDDRSGCKEPFNEDLTCANHTGSHHLTAVAWHAFALLEFVHQHPDYDDRYKEGVKDNGG